MSLGAAKLTPGKRPDALSDMVLEEGPTDTDNRQAGMRPAQLVTAKVQTGVAQYVAGRRPVRDEIVCQAGEEFLHHLQAAGQQRMYVRALRHAAARCGVVGKLVAVDNGDPVVRIGQHASGEQASHAGAEYKGVVAELRWSSASLLISAESAPLVVLGIQVRSCSVVLTCVHGRHRRPHAPSTRTRRAPCPG